MVTNLVEDPVFERFFSLYIVAMYVMSRQQSVGL